MISVMANATLEFTNGEQTVKAVIGLNRLPDWVGKTEYFALCKKGLAPLITEFEGSSDKSLNEAEALRLENVELRNKLRAHEEAKEQIEIAEVVADQDKSSDEHEEKEPKKKR